MSARVRVLGLLVVLGALAWPASALAATPIAETFSARATGATTETVHGSVDPSGLATTYHVVYDVASSEWCESEGFFGSASHESASQPLGFTDEFGHEVAIHISGLTGGEGYCAALEASNLSGPETGFTISFSAGQPTAELFGAIPTGASTATLSGEIGPAGQSTKYRALYALSTSLWCTSEGTEGSPSMTAEQTLSFTDAGEHHVAVHLTALTTGKEYCAALEAKNASASTTAGQISFTLGQPEAFASGLHPSSASSATLEGSVNPGGQTTTYKALYDLASSEWCTSSGASGSPGKATSPATLPYTDIDEHSVAIHITGLTGGKEYCAAIEASNAAATTITSQLATVAGTPVVHTVWLQGTGPATATARGEINPVGQSTSYRARYALATDEWCTSGGTSGSPTNTSLQPLAATDASEHTVSIHITALSAGKGYCAEIEATNASGSATGSQVFATIGGTVAVASVPVSVTGATTATASGDVNPGGQATTYEAVYGLASTEWCQTNGALGSPPSSTTAQPLPFTDESFHFVSVHLTGLTAGSEYCASVQGTNGSGSSKGFLFKFVAGAPRAFTSAAGPTSGTTATVSGVVGPGGQSTSYEVLYGPSSSEWCETAGAKGSAPTTSSSLPLGFTDAGEHQVAVHLTGLTAGQRYCAALRATNGSATATGLQVAFIEGEPVVEAFEGRPTGATSATVAGSVNPGGQSTTYKVIYDLASSEWCESEAATGAPAGATTPQTLGFTDLEEHQVSINVSALTAGKQYCAVIQASNSLGTAVSEPVTFTAGEPIVFTGEARPTGATTATVSGAVNPMGQTTTFKVQYDLAGSEWCESGGSSSSPANSTSAQALPFIDASEHAVAVHLSSLTPGKRYCAIATATNASATAAGQAVTFTEGEPQSFAEGAQATAATTAAVTGNVDAAGQTTTYKAIYDLAGSEWCESFGVSGTPAGSTPPQTLGFTDTSFHAVSVNFSGLTAGKQYCVAIQAANATATTVSFPLTFTAGAPSVEVSGFQATGATSASLPGTVDPSGQSTTYKAIYGLASSEWCESEGESGSAASATSPQTLGFTDTTAHPVSASITGLTAGTRYCAALVAENGAGTAISRPTGFSVGAPSAATTGGKASAATTFALAGTVIPGGQTTTYKALYDLASSEWCESHGGTGSPGSTTAGQTLPFTDTNSHPVSVAVTGLTPGQHYCAAIQASNPTGTSSGAVFAFTAGSPSAITFGAQTTSGTAAEVSGGVNPAGQTTTYTVLYDLATSEWCESLGASGAPADSTTPQTLTFTDAAEHFVEVSVTTLTTGKHYCAALQASNGSATATAAVPVFFTVGEPFAEAFEATPTGATTATVAGVVDPAGQSTTYKALYDLAGSEWCESEGASSSPAHSTSPQSLGATDTEEHEVSVKLSALTAGKQYCVSLQASNAAGNSTSEQILFTAGTPIASTFLAKATGAGTASVSGSVDPAGQATSYKAAYDLASSEWCESHGGSSTPAHSTTAQSLGFTDAEEHAVNVGLSGLAEGQQYCAAIQASNATATSTGATVLFTATGGGPAPPAATTEAATSVTQTGATLNATVNPNASNVTDCKFEYGTTTGYGTSVACASLPGFGISPVAVSAALTGLSPNTTYHFRISATNGGGTTKGFDQELKTQPLTVPTVNTGAASAVTQTGATLNATVNPNGGTVTDCKFEYGPTTGYGSTAPCSSLPGSGTSAVPVSASLSGLAPHSTYHFRISATNGGGTVEGEDEEVETLSLTAPAVVTQTATSVTRTGATLHATVNPNASNVTDCKFEYGTTAGYGTSILCASLPGSGPSPVAVSAVLTGLAPGTSYHFRISATNAVGTQEGSDEELKTLALTAPTVATQAATSVTQTAATLHATVNPNESNVTECQFEYGTTVGYGTSIPCASLPGSGAGAVPASAALAGLTAGTTYHFRISATNGAGTSKGSDQTFATAAPEKPAEGGGGAGGSGGGGAGGGSGGGTPPPALTPLISVSQLQGQLVPSGKKGRIAVLVKSGGYALLFKAPGAGSILIEWFQVPHGAKLAAKKPKPVLLASGRGSLAAGGSVTVRIKLTSAGKRLLKKAKRLGLTAEGIFTAPDGRAAKATKAFTLKR